jgi:hypothetical protein
MDQTTGAPLVLEKLDLLPDSGMQRGKWPYFIQVRAAAVPAAEGPATAAKLCTPQSSMQSTPQSSMQSTRCVCCPGRLHLLAAQPQHSGRCSARRPAAALHHVAPAAAAAASASAAGLSQEYSGGDACTLKGGKTAQRSVQARFACSPDGQLHLLVREPDFCTYIFVVYSPALCALERYKPFGAQLPTSSQ